jgi:hypothetical protein
MTVGRWPWAVGRGPLAVGGARESRGGTYIHQGAHPVEDELAEETGSVLAADLSLVGYWRYLAPSHGIWLLVPGLRVWKVSARGAGHAGGRGIASEAVHRRPLGAFLLAAIGAGIFWGRWTDLFILWLDGRVRRRTRGARGGGVGFEAPLALFRRMVCHVSGVRIPNPRLDGGCWRAEQQTAMGLGRLFFLAPSAAHLQTMNECRHAKMGREPASSTLHLEMHVRKHSTTAILQERRVETTTDLT